MQNVHVPALARRMKEQEWIYDRLIAAGGADFYWPMTEETLCTVGMDGSADIKSVRGGIKRVAHITREMVRIAQKRESMAKEAEAEGHLITAGKNYFMAAAYYTMSQGPIHGEHPLNHQLSEKKNACYASYMQYAMHPVRAVDIPFGSKSLPAYLHLPPHVKGPCPCVVFLGGMDNFKEMLVTSGDKFLERGIAVLAIDGPGQNEAKISHDISVSADNFVDAGRAAMDYLLTLTEIDSQKIGITGISMGSYWVMQIAAADTRYKAACGFYVCHESGMHTIFDVAIPMFKDRYMWMSGYTNEEEFDAFAKTLTLQGLGEKIKCPILMIAGEDDDLSPIDHSYKLYDEITAPKTLVVYKNELHGVSDNLDVRALMADWMTDRFADKPLVSRCIHRDCRTGKEVNP